MTDQYIHPMFQLLVYVCSHQKYRSHTFFSRLVKRVSETGVAIAALSMNVNRTKTAFIFAFYECSKSVLEISIVLTSNDKKLKLLNE